MTRARQAGMAVISALLVVAAVSVIAAGMLDRQSTQLRLLESEQARVQARWLLAGGVDWARVLLRADGRRHATTRPDQIWATPIVDLRISQDDDPRTAVFSGRIEDEQGKFNLQNLALGGQADPAQVAAFARLLQALGLPADPAVQIAARIARSQAPAPTGRQQAAASLRPQAPGLRSILDLRGAGIFDDGTLQRLRAYVTVLPEHTAVNVNTAPAEVLHALIGQLSLAQALALVDERGRGRYFNDRADFVNRLADPEIDVPERAVATDSAWFGVSGSVRIARATVDLHALVQRDGRATPRIVWMAEPN